MEVTQWQLALRKKSLELKRPLHRRLPQHELVHAFAELQPLQQVPLLELWLQLRKEHLPRLLQCWLCWFWQLWLRMSVNKRRSARRRA